MQANFYNKIYNNDNGNYIDKKINKKKQTRQ